MDKTLLEKALFALIFIHDLLDENNCSQYLDRWASHQRSSRPLSKGYIGLPEDVVFSINAWGKYGHFDFPDNPEESGILARIWTGKVASRFNLQLHYSKNKYEPPRVYRRLQLMRRWGYENENKRGLLSYVG